ncbi:type II toxin-antitoxin system Phd/YefM family antitoxin [Carnobacteriaceae bacterium zg-ZUI252]|nr:type II toxin-antitoxin system Phd/YefM family antitoxin [Carnobacteriaceae bacterium zg-ZUI252]MBS4769919.1 type II toxin-antitoxin system Phd/YefM family antitoxin [Carnobacteriaceae bacterium zg-ZUI240]QTU83328.1 type II toxin-antitoxin system Phd/YefM family antitoxin [Carnobacteriaceae bacterium zg-C25]
MNITTTTLRKDIFKYLENVVDFNEVINVNTKKGNAVIISEADYNGLLETLYIKQYIKDEMVAEWNAATAEDFEPFEW